MKLRPNNVIVDVDAEDKKVSIILSVPFNGIISTGFISKGTDLGEFVEDIMEWKKSNEPGETPKLLDISVFAQLNDIPKPEPELASETEVAAEYPTDAVPQAPEIVKTETAHIPPEEGSDNAGN